MLRVIIFESPPHTVVFYQSCVCTNLYGNSQTLAFGSHTSGFVQRKHLALLSASACGSSLAEKLEMTTLNWWNVIEVFP